MTRLKLSIIFLLILLIIKDVSAKQKKFTVWRLQPTEKEQIEFLQTMHMNDVKLDFWKSPSEIGKEVHVMLSDEKSEDFLKQLDDHSINHSVMIDDVQKVIVEQKEKRDKLRKQVRLRDWREEKVSRA
ncbi:unnamed protein product [Caenorhabditis angaria]|uniref:Zinc carboxypeptidase A 1 n=1 Tax=Caenorhabditis angaria TaxID=860376 RepID=A0A9P1I3W9_9PELO|nr:unnamed protein product [Caenorhabditis angaria]